MKTATSSSPRQWLWRDYPITYQTAGEQNKGVAVVLIHGFGASWGHWRKNLPELGRHFRCYAIDLIGFGGSAKPKADVEVAYTFETWAQQIADFCAEVVGSSAFLVGNSIGCIVAMQTAVSYPDAVQGVALINCSLRMLHDRKRAELPWYRSFGAPIVQNLLGQEWIGNLFFKQLAKPNVVRNILKQAYQRPEAVSDELIEILMKPAGDQGAAGVFVAFTRYSSGPLPEDLLPILPCPALILWGTDDPWEPIELAQKFADYETVEKFIPLAGLGHCPQDEAPEVVNPLLQEWLSTKSQSQTNQGEPTFADTRRRINHPQDQQRQK